MLTLEEEIGVFLKKNPPPEGWKENLMEYLPAAGEVSEQAPLVHVRAIHRHEENCREILVLKACEVCTNDRCARYGVVAPNGVWGKWGNLAPLLVEKRLIERLNEVLMARRLSKIPKDVWFIEYYFLNKKETPVGTTS